jgi:hypothetical protein
MTAAGISGLRAGLLTGFVLILVIAALVWRGLATESPAPAPALTPAEVLLDAHDRSAAACVTREEIMRVVTTHALRWSETAPLDCTDAPPETAWLRITAEDRVRHYAFGPDGCRIAVAEAACP